MEARYAYQIDSLRLIAMISIFCNHVDFLKLNPKTDYLFEHYFHYGGIGVEFFILLSGFMAAISFNPETSYFDYIKKRALRLFPVHWFCIVFFLPFNFNISWGVIGSLFLSLGLLQSATPLPGGIFHTFNPASWTISTLWMIFLIAPFLIRSAERINKLKALVLLLLSMVVGYCLNSNYYYEAEWFFYVSPFYRVITFMQGILVASLFKNIKVESKCHQTRAIATIVELFVLMFFVAELLYVTPFSNKGYFYTFPIALIIGVFYVGGGEISKLLCSKVLVKLSKLSFSFYMIHYLICEIISPMIIDVFLIEKSVFNLMTIFFADFIICFILASIIRNTIELKLTQMLKNKLLSHRV